MDEVRDIAMTYYSKLTEKQREEVEKYFQSMDRNGDGKIEFSEFLDFLRVKESSRSWNDRLFKDLDKDGNGTLDFNEFITFYYLKIFTVATRCDGCGVILNGNIFFTCVQCFNKKPRISTFDLCRSCFSNDNFTHAHENGVVPVFRDTSSLLLLAWKQNAAGQVAVFDDPNVNSARAFVAGVESANSIINLIGNILSSGCTIM